MSTVLYIDCFAGAAGDMFLGALLDLGAPLEVVRAEIDKLGVPGLGLRAVREARHQIEGVRVHVELGERVILEGAALEIHVSEPHPHPHPHPHRPSHVLAPPSRHDAPGRRYTEIDALLARAGLAPRTESLARQVFRNLALAEAKVHGLGIDSVHFHEVGAADALADVVGSCAALSTLGPDRVVCAPVPLGRGVMRGAHGSMPLPSPATLELLSGAPVYGLAEEGETVTPTGAALLATLASRFGPVPPMRVRRVGHGVGARDPASRPNLLRMVLGEEEERAAGVPLCVLECNIDDMSGELFGHAMEALFAQGARDVWLTPIYMKKNRPATLLSVLCTPVERDGLVELILRETTTLGVRVSEATRFELSRELREVDTPYGRVRVKVARSGSELFNVAPEIEDCRRVAAAAGVPLKRVYQAAFAAALPEEAHAPR